MEALIFQHILIAIDGSPLAERALRQGLELARAVRARVSLLNVPERLASVGDRHDAFARLPDAIRRDAEAFLAADADRILTEADAVARKAGIEPSLLAREADHPHEGIIAAAREAGADLIVMASHGRSGVAALLLGSVTQKVLTHSEIPVLVCR